jgi:hypothetical protein
MYILSLTVHLHTLTVGDKIIEYFGMTDVATIVH